PAEQRDGESYRPGNRARRSIAARSVGQRRTADWHAGDAEPYRYRKAETQGNRFSVFWRILMTTTNHYRVTYHWENNGKIVNHQMIDDVAAADNSYNTIKGVIV